MADNLFDALEVCLQALEKGADLESCLARFPELAVELRPMLEAAGLAREQAVREVPEPAMRRGRALLLRHAAEMRERDHAAAVPLWRRSGRAGRAVRLAATLVTTLVFLLFSGTGLVFASSKSLPGDNLYTVKRSWEDVQLALTVDPKARIQRQTEFEQERIQEIETLFSESRQTQVNFQGVVQSQKPGVWQIAGLKIAVDSEVNLNGRIVPGSIVQVIGETENGLIKAEQITLLGQAAFATPTSTPTSRPSWTPEPRKTEGPTEGSSGSDDGASSSQVEATQQPENTETPGQHGGGETPGPGGDHSSSGGGDGGHSNSGGGDGGHDGGGNSGGGDGGSSGGG